MFKDYKNVYAYTWTVENFSFCPQRTGSSLYCSFIDNNITERLWRLELYPRGHDKRSSAFISCFLQIFNTEVAHLEDRNFSADIEYGFKIEIIGGSGKILRSSEEKITRNVWESSKFLETKKVIQDAEDSQNDTLTVRCYVYGNNSEKEAFERNVLRTKMLVNRLYCSWDKNIMVERILQENFVFPKKAEFKIVLTLIDDILKVNITKENSKSFTDYFVECKLVLLACDVYDENKKTTNYLCTQKATHFFKSMRFSHPEKWEYPSDIISEKLNDYNAAAILSKTPFSFRIICELKCSSGLEEVLPVTVTDTNAAVKKHPTLQEDLKCMFLGKKYCDVKLRVDNQIIEAHKNVLTSRSPVFSSMFDHNMMEAHTGIVDIVDIDLNTLYLFLEFLYTDTVNEMDFKQVKSLIIAAEKYEVLSLKEKCADVLYSEMSVENVCEVLVLADIVTDTSLKSAAIDFIDANAEKVLTSQDWMLWKKSHVELTTEVYAKLAATNSQIAESACISSDDQQEKRRRLQ